MKSPRNDRSRSPRRHGFDDDTFYGNTPAPSLPSFGGGASAPELDASVTWYNPEKGFGFVVLADGSGDAFLHVRALEAAGLGTVSPGATLRVRVGQGQKGRQVNQIISVDESTAAEQPRVRGSYGSGPNPRRSGRSQVDLSTAVEMVGTVKWYSPEKGFGFIARQDGGKDVFVHASALERSGVSALQEGQSVRIQVIQGAKGLETASLSVE